MGTFLGVPIIRIIIYWGLHWGPLILGNYHLIRPKALFKFFRSKPYLRGINDGSWFRILTVQELGLVLKDVEGLWLKIRVEMG